MFTINHHNKRGEEEKMKRKEIGAFLFVLQYGRNVVVGKSL